jgi:hypothetical protein
MLRRNMEEFKFIPIHGWGAESIAKKVEEVLKSEENKDFEYHELIYQGQFSFVGTENIIVLKKKRT